MDLIDFLYLRGVVGHIMAVKLLENELHLTDKILKEGGFYNTPEVNEILNRVRCRSNIPGLDDRSSYLTFPDAIGESTELFTSMVIDKKARVILQGKLFRLFTLSAGVSNDELNTVLEQVTMDITANADRDVILPRRTLYGVDTPIMTIVSEGTYSKILKGLENITNGMISIISSIHFDSPIYLDRLIWLPEDDALAFDVFTYL